MDRGDHAAARHGGAGLPGQQQPQYSPHAYPPSHPPGDGSVMSGSAGGDGGIDTGGQGGPGSVGGGGGGGGGPSPGAGPTPRPIRRRMRMITSCLECRRRKLKCNKSQPCTNCLKFSRDCLYLGPKLDEASQLRLTEIKEKVGSLERQFERDVAKTTSKAAKQQRILADDVEDEYSEERDLEPTDMTALDITYEEDADGTDDVIDLGVQVGRMRITERIGGLSRPRISEEISAGISGQRQPPGFGGGPPRAGPPPGYPGFPGGPPPGMDSMSMTGGSEGSIPDFLKPGASYIPPSSGFFFGHMAEMPSLERMLPTKEAGDRLMQQYFGAVHPVARCVHRPSFEADYQNFWEDIYANYEPRASTQAVMFAAWFSAAVSMDEAIIRRDFGFTKPLLIEKLKHATEASLSKANFLRTTRVETMQGFIMYMLPLCRAEVSRAHSVLVGAAVRMAECMGLHRDGETYGLNPLDTHVRRLIWHQLCFLDIRTCEAQGPRPAIRREDYDTKLPVNCEETDLIHASSLPPDTAEQWTSTLLTLIRFEINEMMRIIWMDRRKLESRKSTLTTVLTKIENFRKRIFEKYDRFLDDRVPLQRYAKLVMHLLLYRLHVMVLHPYHANANSPMPHRLNNILIMSGIMIIEIAIQLETDHLFREWTWYMGAYQQFHVALLLATEVYYRPHNREAARIWSCLDYVFNTDRTLPPEAKGLQILGEIMSKTAIYQGMRKMRAPTGTLRAAPSKHAVAGKGGAGSTMPPHLQQYPQQSHMPPMGMKTEAGMHSPPSMGMGPGGPPGASPMGPPPNIVFAGVSNGEAIWSVPPMDPHSPENSSDGGSVAGGHGQRMPPQMGMMNQLENLDWDVIDSLFPQDPNTGELNISGFHDPSIVLNYQRHGDYRQG